jgi:hypothetical protein
MEEMYAKCKEKKEGLQLDGRIMLKIFINVSQRNRGGGRVLSSLNWARFRQGRQLLRTR